MGLSESGASQERSETTVTAAAITPAPASTYPRLARPSRRTRRFGRARRAGAFTPRPLWRISSSMGFSIRSTPYRKIRRTKTPPAISPAPKPSVSSETIATGRRRKRPG